MTRGTTRVLIGVALLALVVLGGGLLLPRFSIVERTKEIAAPPATVYALLSDLRAGRRWSPWRDPRSRYLFSGPAIGAGAHMEWSGPTQGASTIELADPYKRVVQRIEVRGAERRSAFALTPTAEGVRVDWRLSTDAGNNPLTRWSNLTLPYRSSLWLERGLDRLGDVAEALPHVDMAAAKVRLVKAAPRRFVYVSGKTDRDPVTVAKALSSGAKRAGRALAHAGLQPSGGPIWVAEAKPGTERVSYRAGLPFTGEGAPEGPGLEVADLPAGAAIQAEQVGAPTELAQTEAAAHLFRGIHQLAPAGPPVLEFSADPLETPPDQLRTVVRLPVGT